MDLQLFAQAVVLGVALIVMFGIRYISRRQGEILRLAGQLRLEHDQLVDRVAELEDVHGPRARRAHVGAEDSTSARTDIST